MIFFTQKVSCFDLSCAINRFFCCGATLVCLGLASPALSQIIDEAGVPTHQADAAVTNREMRNTVNLKKVQGAFDKSKPQDNAKTYTYKANSTFKIRLREFMQTVVVFPAGEKIKGQVLGDATNFAFKPIPGSANRAVVWGRDPGADTNLTVFGESGKIYSFYLRIDSVESAFVPDLLVYVMDDSIPYDVAQAGQVELGLDGATAKPTDAAKGPTAKDPGCLECLIEEYPAQQFQRDYLRELPQTSGRKANTEFVMSRGSRELAPMAIFDDGYFTYFKYGEGNLDSIKVPVLYQVIDGYDSLLNTRVEGGYIVAETTNDKFTIRRGDKFLCIKNKKYTKTTALKD